MILQGKRSQYVAATAQLLGKAAVLVVVIAMLLSGCVHIGSGSSHTRVDDDGKMTTETSGWCFVGILIPIIPVPYSWGCESSE
jgi:hypothetical protein